MVTKLQSDQRQRCTQVPEHLHAGAAQAKPTAGHHKSDHEAAPEGHRTGVQDSRCRVPGAENRRKYRPMPQ
jgi:hypothetical protein